MNQPGFNSQYNNFIKQAQQSNSIGMGGNSRNNANGLTSKTHTDSMIYNGNSNMNSFQGGLNNSGLGNMRM
jgi:hypothetical protein